MRLAKQHEQRARRLKNGRRANWSRNLYLRSARNLGKRDYLRLRYVPWKGGNYKQPRAKGYSSTYVHIPRESVARLYTVPREKGTFATKSKRRILRYASIFVAFAHRFQSVIPKSSHSRVDLHFSTEFLSFLLVESLTFDKKVSFPLADRFSLFWPR